MPCTAPTTSTRPSSAATATSSHWSSPTPFLCTGAFLLMQDFTVGTCLGILTVTIKSQYQTSLLKVTIESHYQGLLSGFLLMLDFMARTCPVSLAISCAWPKLQCLCFTCIMQTTILCLHDCVRRPNSNAETSWKSGLDAVGSGYNKVALH